MSDNIILTSGADGDEDGEGYIPQVFLEHDEDRHEMYVVVGEEVGGMIEGISTETFEMIRKNVRT